MKKYSELKIAIVHDSIRFYGGAERVLSAFHKLFPSADIYTSIISWENIGKFTQTVQKMNITTSWAQRFPPFRAYPFLFRYFLPFIWRSFNLSSYDLIISLSGAQMSHLVKKNKTALHICYSFTPPRHLFGYKTDFFWNKWRIIRMVCVLGNFMLNKINTKAIHQVDLFIACSVEISKRIKRFYNRNSEVVYPPVQLATKNLSIKHNQKPRYLLSVSRLSRMKNIDVIIKAADQLKIPLHIVGTGPEDAYLKSITPDTNIFLDQCSDAQLQYEYANCLALVCAAEDEDFGIVPVEAMSFGKPVIAYNSGGYKETVVNGKTGILFEKLTPECLIKAIHKLENSSIIPQDCINQSEKFSKNIFIKKIINIVKSEIKSKI